MIDALLDFLESPVRSQWLRNEFMKVYVRKSHHHIGDLIKTLDTATIEVYPEFQRQGKCSEFLVLAHQINRYQATFIENVLHGFLRWR